MLQVITAMHFGDVRLNETEHRPFMPQVVLGDDDVDDLFAFVPQWTDFAGFRSHRAPKGKFTNSFLNRFA